MRIIAGRYRGKVLKSPKDEKTIRPTTDRVKENIFNIIQNKIADATVLDLFSGSGAIGIESLSRGAKECVFVDESIEAIDLIGCNTKFIDEKFSIIRKNYSQALESLAKEKKKFDIIFLDPPYSAKFESDIISKIVEFGLLADKGIIILERLTILEKFNLPLGIGIADSREYGKSTVDIISKLSSCAITGTFDPITLGHLDLLKYSIENYEKVHIVVLINPDKVMLYSLDQRLQMLNLATKDYKNKIVISFFEGLAIDYCRQNGIQYIIRGYRNNTDFEYEEIMADYNLKNGGITTKILKATHMDISSTKVRELLQKELPLEEYLHPNVIKFLKKEAKQKSIREKILNN